MDRRLAPALLASVVVPLAACQGNDGGATAPDATVVLEDCPAPPAHWRMGDVPETTGAGCPARRPASTDLAGARRVGVAVYHFNLQYVAGGLKGFAPGDAYDLDEVEVEDRIVVQGLEPLLDAYLDHPDLGADVELQAYMVEVIAQRHPDVLTKMQTLAGRGQIDFDSFHYSDQLWVAYPRRDMEVSLDLTQGVFGRACLPVGRSVFTQEGQFAAGQVALASEHGRTVSIVPKNLFRWQFGEEAARHSVLYADPAVPGHTVLVGGTGWSSPDPGVEVELVSTFMDDGEIAFSQAELPPYAGELYLADPDRIGERMAELRRLADAGVSHVRVADAVQALLDAGVEPEPMPPVLDGTWQPDDTDNVGRWMGGRGLFPEVEADGEVLGALWRARRRVVLAEQAAPAEDPVVRAAWRELLLGQVSDSTGWNPFSGEVAYSFTHAAAAEALADAVLACHAPEYDGPPGPECEEDGTDSLAGLGVAVATKQRPAGVTVRTCTLGARPGTLRQLQVHLAPAATDLPSLAWQTLDVSFDLRDRSDLQYVPALRNTFVPLSLEDYVVPAPTIPLPHGVIGLGRDTWVVQDHATGQTAARIDGTSITFSDRTLPLDRAVTRRWYVLDGAAAAQAHALAEAVNGPF